ncbi:MAG: hypothetical protein AAB722_01480 [Patescibacteria group bacterium]
MKTNTTVGTLLRTVAKADSGSTIVAKFGNGVPHFGVATHRGFREMETEVDASSPQKWKVLNSLKKRVIEDVRTNGETGYEVEWANDVNAPVSGFNRPVSASCFVKSGVDLRNTGTRWIQVTRKK